MAENKKPEAAKKKAGNAYVTTEFRDKDNFDKVYEVDQDLSDHDRLDELIAAGVVTVHAEEKEPAK